MTINSFLSKVRSIFEPILSQYNYLLMDQHNIDTIVFRKELMDWFLFIEIQHDSRTNQGNDPFFYINVYKLKTDNPRGMYLRDENGQYIVGSQIGRIGGTGFRWRYEDIYEMEAQINQSLIETLERIPSLEDSSTVIDYKGRFL